MTYVFGEGGLAHEFVSFGKFHAQEVIYISKEKESIIDWQSLIEQDVYVLIADNSIRRALFARLNNYGISAKTFIHPSAIVGDRTVIGQGAIISPNCIISNDVKIGTGVFINSACSIGHDCKIGDFVSLMPGCYVSGNNNIGQDSFFGTATKTIPGINIYPRTKTGIGTVLIRGTRKEGLYFGNPAKLI